MYHFMIMVEINSLYLVASTNEMYTFFARWKSDGGES